MPARKTLLSEKLINDERAVGAVKEIKRAGFWAQLIACLLPIPIFIAFLRGMLGVQLLYVLMYTLIAASAIAYFWYTGHLLKNLKLTERDLRLVLITNAIFSLILVSGLIPIMLLVTSIFALISFNTYIKLTDDKPKKRKAIYFKPKHYASQEVRVVPKKITTNNKVRIIVKKLLVLAIALIVFCIILVGFDWYNYMRSERSILFGIINKYEQSQILKFGGLNVKVDSVTISDYPTPTIPVQPAQTDCSGLSKTAADPNTAVGRLSSPYGLCTLRLSFYQQDLADYETNSSIVKEKREILVKFQYENVDDSPINLASYTVKLIANTPLNEYSKSLKVCTGMAKTNSFLKGYVEKECLSRSINKDYDGPVALSVTNSGKVKIISLKLPN